MNDRDLQQANAIAVSLHGVAATIAGVNGVKQPTEATRFVNPFGHVLKVREAKALIDTATARTTLQLWDNGRMPGWAIEFLDRDLLEAAAS